MGRAAGEPNILRRRRLDENKRLKATFRIGRELWKRVRIKAIQEAGPNR